MNSNNQVMRVEVCGTAAPCGNITTVQHGDSAQICKNTQGQHYRVWNGEQPSGWKQMGDRCLVFDNSNACFDVYPCNDPTQCDAPLNPKNTTAQAPKRSSMPMTATTTTQAQRPQAQQFVSSNAKSSGGCGCGF